MKYIFPTLLLIFPLVASAEIYKCKQPGGKLGFSDKPCADGAIQEKITIKSKSIDWVSRLRSEKPISIKIIDVLREDGDVTIKYEFTTQPASNEFMRLKNNVSNMPVALMKYIDPKSNALGYAEIKASNKPRLFPKLKRANK